MKKGSFEGQPFLSEMTVLPKGTASITTMNRMVLKGEDDQARMLKGMPRAQKEATTAGKESRRVQGFEFARASGMIRLASPRGFEPLLPP